MSLRNKIFIVLIIAAVLPLALVAATFFPFHQDQLTKREVSLMEAASKTRADRATTAVKGTSHETLQQIADQIPSLGESPEVLIFAKDPSGRFTLATTPRFEATRPFPYDDMQPLLEEALQTEAGAAPPHAAIQDQRGVMTVMVARRVPDTDHAVIVKMDRQEILRPDFTLRDQFLVLSFIAIALAALLALMLARSVTGPLLRLSRTVATFDSDKPARIEVDGNDEVSTLAKSFRSMWEKVKGYNADLEKAVWERTGELTAAKDALERSNAALAARLEEIEKLYGMVISRDMSAAEVKAHLEKLRGDTEKK